MKKARRISRQNLENLLENLSTAFYRDVILKKKINSPLFSETELAETYNVNVATARKFYQRLLKTGVVGAEHRKGYFLKDPTLFHSKWKSQKETVIGITGYLEYKNPMAPYNQMSQILGVFEKMSNEHGWRVQLFNTYPSREITQELLGSIERDKEELSCLFHIPIAKWESNPSSDFASFKRDIKKLHKFGIPMLTTDHPSDLATCISYDNRQIGTMATEYLIGLGHRRIAHVTLPGFDWAAERKRAYMETLSNHILPVKRSLIIDVARDDKKSYCDCLMKLKDQRVTAMLYSGWTAGVNAAAFESGALWEAESSPIIAMQRQIMKRYTDSPALGGWHLNRGQPIGDMLGVANGGCLWDSSEAGRKAYVEYLKGKYTLPELGERWFGDKERFKSWSGVIPMEISALLGGAYEKDRLVLSDKSWQWQKSSKDSWEKPPLPDSPWVDIAMPPSQRCTLLDSGSAYYKVTFQGDDFLKKHGAAGLYLKMLLSTYDSNKTNVWVNGQKLNTAPHYSSGVKLAQVEVLAGMLRADGNNEIIIQTPDGRSDGRLHGTVSLSPLTAENYPFNDPGLNAQYVDDINFQTMSMASRVEQTIKYARQFDPDRPMVISGGSWDTPCLLMPIMAKYGVGHQYTAAEGFLNAQYPGIAGSFDYYFSAESSGSVLDAEKFNRMLGMMFYQGASTFDMFHNIGEYLDFDKKTGYMTATAPLLHLFGKYLTEPTNMAIFWSSAIPQCENVWNWNLGRGEIQSSHFATDYLNEQALEAGKGNKYDVLFDCGNEILTEKAISLLRKYVENGGTYVVLPPTGRHGQLRKDTQPVRELSGFQVLASGMTGNIRFSKDPSIFKCWADQTFKGDGKASDWKDIPVVSKQSIELKPISQDTEILASWESGGAAIGLRRLGKGRVITLGSTFWRDGRDINGKWLPSRKNELFSTLLKELGAMQDTGADSEKIWLRNAITKNGLEHWLIASNIAETVPYEITSDLEFQLAFKPEQVIDRVSGKAVAFTVDANNRVHLPKVEFNKYQTRIFSVSIPQDLSVTVKAWWLEKTKYWRAAPEEKLPLPEEHSPSAIDLSSWSFLPDKDGRLAGNEQWKETGFDDSGWRQIKSGSWKLSEPDLKDYNGPGLYRFKFAVPESWNGHRVTLNYLSPPAYDQAEFFLNGKAVAKSDVKTYLGELAGTENFDISEVVKRGKDNILAVKVTVSNKTANLAGICNMVWLAKEQTLDPVIDLNGKWDVIMGDLFTLKNAEVPGKSTCRYIRRGFNVPNDWKGKTVYLHLESPYNNIGAIVINDKVRAEGQGFQSFPTRAEINISDMIIPGQINKIEIWQRFTVPVNWRGIDWKWPKEASLAVRNVVIGCITEDKEK